MSIRRCVIAAGCLLLGRFSVVAAQDMGRPTEEAGVTSAEVERAIARAKAYLYAQQRDGNWEESPRKQPTGGGMGGPGMGGPGGPGGPGMGGPPMMDGRGRNPEVSSQWGGLSSIATFALLAAGEPDQDERIAKAVLFLKSTNDVTGSYALGLHAQVWPLIPAVRLLQYKPNVQRDGTVLLRGLRQNGDARGLYHYTPDDPGWDNSTAQFGVLGMWACAQLGFEVPSQYWKEVEDAWLRHQDASGGWSYGGDMGGPGMGGPPMRGPGQGRFQQGPPGGRGMAPGGGFGGPPDPTKVTLSMTAAGVATLFITQDYLHGDGGCKGNYSNPPIEAGLHWISDHFNELSNDSHYFYTLFGISRIGVASGYKYFGSKDWYKDGAAQLVAAQQPDGSWGNSVSDTSFALLFLVRGRAPVVMNKLQYTLTPAAPRTGKPLVGNWDQRPRDAANITRWVGKQLERGLNWQVVNLTVDPAELHDSPILYIAGNQPLSFTEAEEGKLRVFVEQGGMILGNADCANKAFSDSFKKLGQRLFKKYEFRTLLPDHLIYTGELTRPGKKPPIPLEGMSNGCRELMILIPTADPARYWQTRSDVGREEFHQVLANIYLYAVDKGNARYKGDSYIVQPDPRVVARAAIQVARLQCGDNWDPEPGGWQRLAAVLHNQHSTGLTTEVAPLGAGKLDGFTIAHWTGTTKVALNDAQRAELKKFVAAGGTLIVDAAGGSTQFASTAEAELVKMFGDDKGFFQPLPPDHPLYTAGDQKITTVGYRRFAQNLVSRLKSPRLRGIAVDGRLAVVFSPEDLTEGLVGEPVDGILGYDPETATALMCDILQYASTKH